MGDFAPEYENVAQVQAQAQVAVLQRHHCRLLRDQYRGRRRKEGRYGGSGLEANQETTTQADVYVLAHTTHAKDVTHPHENQTAHEHVAGLVEDLSLMNSENSRFED